ncbi:MAG: DivIVA domain-containing protein [Ignavibacteria bacterium]|nr:DivIVA domain-containing protein [Ignavibacteria bacterium]
MKKLFTSYNVPVLLGILIFASDFLNTSLFNFGDRNFAVWFVLSILCFACGWYINKSLGWQLGGRVVFAVIVSVTIISIAIIVFFNEYFATFEVLTENLILFSLRNITLGAMGIFGMAIQEVVSGEKEALILREKVKVLEATAADSKKEAELLLKEASLKAEKIINDSEANAKNTILKKERIEQELKDFIQIERELIKRYEDLK